MAEPPPSCYPLAMAPTRKPPKAPWQIWLDGTGRLSLLRIITLTLLLTPVVIAIHDYNAEGFGARPINNVIHRTGYWTLLFVMMALAVTPLRRIARFNQLVDVRRMIGVGAFVYAASHILLFTADQKFDLGKVASEIVLRVYLAIGFVALLGLTALAVTSTDGMVRRLGKRWQMLHQAIYVIGVLVLIHFFQQTKADVWQPILVASLFAWMIGYRVLIKLRKSRGEPPAWQLASLTVVVVALTFIVEAIGIAISFNTSPLRVLENAFEFDLDVIRPGWVVLAAGALVVCVDLVQSRVARSRRPARPAPMAARAPEMA